MKILRLFIITLFLTVIGNVNAQKSNEEQIITAVSFEGNKDCQLALVMNAYRIRKYIGSYTAALNGLDAIIFTAGIGENPSYMRKLVSTDMDYFGI